jgi:hypothetical protein
VRNIYKHMQKMKSAIFWDITPCGPLRVNRRFGGTYRHLLSHWFLARLISRPWRWRRYVPKKRRLTLNGLHGVISQKMALFKTTAVRTSNPTYSKDVFSWVDSLQRTIQYFPFWMAKTRTLTSTLQPLCECHMTLQMNFSGPQNSHQILL